MASLAAPAPPRAHARWSARAASALWALSLLLGIVVVAGAGAGYRGEVVLTGSMRPAIAPGDMVVVRRVGITDVARGNVITFSAPSGGRTITHRVVSLHSTRDPAKVAVVTRGDANNVSERWTASRTAQVGRVEAVVPKAGYLTRWAADAQVRVIVFALLSAALLAAGLWWVWRP